MTYYEAALEVLRSAQHPLTLREITDAVVERGLIAPHGRRPQNAMAAVLYRWERNNPELIRTGAPGKRQLKPGSVRWTLRRTA
jgi:HB1, ASXL, restriction endonuclease HTH domain